MPRHYARLEDVKKRIEKEIKSTEFFLNKWKSVTFTTKKDGTPFANMAKNIEGADYRKANSIQDNEYEIYVGGFCEGLGYINEYINAYELVKYLKDENKIAKEHNYMPKVSYLEQVYKYDLDDIKGAISARIDYLERRLNTLKYQYDIAEDAFRKFYEGYGKLLKELAETTQMEDCPSLYYRILGD